MKPRRERRQTIVNRVEQALSTDDLTPQGEVVRRVKHDRAVPILKYLHGLKAVDFILDHGTAYWFLTPESDTRKRSWKERAIEQAPRRRKRKEAKK
jgi:hypothetical protein